MYCKVFWLTLQAASMILQRAPAEGSQWKTWQINSSSAVCTTIPISLKSERITSETTSRKWNVKVNVYIPNVMGWYTKIAKKPESSVQFNIRLIVNISYFNSSWWDIYINKQPITSKIKRNTLRRRQLRKHNLITSCQGKWSGSSSLP